MKSQPAGFTLIELLIVISIVGILTAILVPNLLAARSRAFDSAAASCAKQVASAQEVAFIDSQAYVASLAVLNAVTRDMAGNCEASWVDDTPAFSDGWEIEHPNGTGLVYTVGPGGISPPP